MSDTATIARKQTMDQPTFVLTMPPGDRQNKFLTFTLAGEAYGIAAAQVRGISGMLPLTELPHTPEFVRGVAKLGDRTIVVLDLGLKLGLAAQPPTAQTCIVVVEVNGVEVGVIVDKVSEVITAAAPDIEQAPPLAAGADFVLGLARAGAQAYLLLDINRVLVN